MRKVFKLPCPGGCGQAVAVEVHVTHFAAGPGGGEFGARNCARCKEAFVPRRRDQRFCGVNCRVGFWNSLGPSARRRGPRGGDGGEAPKPVLGPKIDLSKC